MSIKKPTFYFGWNPVATRPTITKDGYYTMREWQEDCFNDLQDAHHWIINAPMASGKSFEICCTAADQLAKDKNLRVVIAVPQTIIASGFRKNKVEFPDGKRFDWFVQHDLCRESSESSTKHLLEFLEGPNSKHFIQDRVALCTHATLVQAFKKNRTTFKNVLIVIDEAHHIKHGEIEELGIQIANGVGSIVQYSFSHPDCEIRIGLTTATFFRGDKNPIIPKKHLVAFKRFNLPYDKFLATCKYLRSFSYDFVLYNKSYTEALSELFKNNIRKTIVYIPSVNSRYTVGSKEDDVQEVLKAICGKDNPKIHDADKPVMRVRKGKKWINVVDLVDENLREEKKDALIKAHDAKTGESVDVVIALNMFKEGANWRWADREIIIGQRGSLTDVIQMIGRLFRDVEGKDHVETYQLLPFALDQIDKDELRDNLNDYLKAIFLSMLLEDIVNPVRIKLPSEDDDKEDENDLDFGGKDGSVDYIKEIFKDEGEAVQILELIREGVLEIVDNDASLLDDTKTLREKFQQVVDTVLADRGIDYFHDEIGEQIWRIWMRRTLHLKGINVSGIDFDIVKENPLEFLLSYTSDVCNLETFRDLRKATQNYYFIPFEELKEIIYKMRENGQPLNSKKEYDVWRANGCDYNAVVKYREESNA